MYLTTKIHIDKRNRDGINLFILEKLCYHSARMYNVGMYSVRQHYFNTKKYLPYYENYHLCKDNENYKILLTDTGQQILRLVDRDMKGFFQLLILKNSGKYSAKVRLPRYKENESLTTCVLQGRSVRVNQGKIRFGLTKEFREKYGINERFVTFTMPKHLAWVTSFKELRIIPRHNGQEFQVELVYEAPKVKRIPETAEGYMSIDLGLDNLMACTVFSNGKSEQFIIDGRPLKSINAYYNKTVATLKSAYSKNKSIESPTTTKRMRRLSNGRQNRISDYLDKAVKVVIDKCFEFGVKTVVVGYNKEQKQRINIGKANNQNFVMIPLHILRSKLQGKCEMHGIAYESQEESYTSKASAIDLDDIPKFGDNSDHEFSGRRVHRGLYRSKDGLLINADINGSMNILRKYFKERKRNLPFGTDRVRALVNRPCQRINPFAQAPSFMEG